MKIKSPFLLSLSILLYCVAPGSAQTQSAVSDLAGTDSSLETGTKDLRKSLAQPRELFKIVEKDGKKHFEIREDQFDVDYLFSASIDKGTGEKDIFDAELLGSFVWFFQKKGKTVHFVRKNTSARAEPGSPTERALKHSFPDSILVALPIASTGTQKGSFVVPVTPLFLADLAGIGEFINQAYPGPNGGAQQSELSSLEGIIAYPKNVEVTSKLIYLRGTDKDSSLPDSRVIPITMHYSLSALPDKSDFTPREADERIGYFTDDHLDFSREDLKDKTKPIVSLINRWNLQKADPSLELSPVRKPITIWLEDKIPFEHRPAIKAGILAWNTAFEAVGLKGAIVVKEVDKDMSPEERKLFNPADASYNTVRWLMGKDADFAEGPVRTNPLTGEILSLTIRVSDAVTRFSSGELDLAAASSKKGGKHDYQAQAARRAARGLGMLKARGGFSPEYEKRYREEYLTHTITHEFGHTLGLRHNFKGSRMLAKDKLGKDGIVSSSVMDYLDAYVPIERKKGDPYFQTKLGVYDFWAVEYGYKTLTGDAKARAKQLTTIANRSANDSTLAYGTEEDLADPDVQQWDHGDDSLAFAKERAALARKLWKDLETRNPTSEEGYSSLRDGYAFGHLTYKFAARAVYPLIGGLRRNRDRPGTSHLPFEPVTIEEQREALKFIDEAVFSAEPFEIDPRLAAKLVTRNPDGSRSPVNLSAKVAAIQEETLFHLLDPSTLAGVQQNQLFATDPAKALSISELMETVRNSIWKELNNKSGATIHTYRRGLQRAHIKALTKILNEPAAPGDARALARIELQSLEKSIGEKFKWWREKPKGIDNAHLSDALSRIKKALGKSGRTG